jgi:hypothetical protein
MRRQRPKLAKRDRVSVVGRNAVGSVAALSKDVPPVYTVHMDTGELLTFREDQLTYIRAGN